MIQIIKIWAQTTNSPETRDLCEKAILALFKCAIGPCKDYIMENILNVNPTNIMTTTVETTKVEVIHPTTVETTKVEVIHPTTVNLIDEAIPPSLKRTGKQTG